MSQSTVELSARLCNEVNKVALPDWNGRPGNDSLSAPPTLRNNLRWREIDSCQRGHYSPAIRLG